MVNMIVLTSTPVNLASVAPVLATLVHFMAISDTVSFKTFISKHEVIIVVRKAKGKIHYTT